MKLYPSFSATVSSLSFFVIAATTSAVDAAVTKTTSTSATVNAEFESLRLRGYEDRGYEWPVPKFVPDTEGWRRIQTDRLEQVADIVDPSERFKGYTTTMYSALVSRNYTEDGFSRSRISRPLLEELQQAIRDGMDIRRNEGKNNNIIGQQAQHIERDDLMAKVNEELHLMMEEWSGVDLDLRYVYGLRLFQNKTALKMHLDKGSHPLGFILHIESSDDYDERGDPWPFLIEDLHGRTHEIKMSPGDVILFEAAKLAHGRPHKLNASWYCNVVGHYYPRDKVWASMNHINEAQFAVPPHWLEQPNEPADSSNDNNNAERIEFRGGMREPGCVDGWCRSTSDNIIKWKGPAGSNTHWIDANGNDHEFMRHKKSQTSEL